MRPMTLPRGAEFIISRLESYGYRADLVGGCVRDFLLSIPCNDYDVTTSASPERVKEIFSDVRTVDTGIKHGTVTVLYEGESYEVTTYRLDGEYLDSRHPASVEFTPLLSEDLARRDFTVNAMCYNPKDGYTDLFGGMEDLERGIIRAVGDPLKRFTEDALRILRAIRFASVLGFTIDSETASALRERSPLMENVSKERVYVEWRKLLAGKSAYSILSDYKDIISCAIFDIRLDVLPDPERFSEADDLIRLLSLYELNYDEPSKAFSVHMQGLRTDNKTRLFGEAVLSVYRASALDNEIDALNLLREIGDEAALATAELGILLGRFDLSSLRLLEDALASGTAYRISDLKVRGGELIALGIRGQKIGDTLERLLTEVIEGRCENEGAQLIACAKEMMK